MNSESVFQQTWDIVVFGGGYAGLAAARATRTAGKSVLLVERRATLLIESGWAFASQTGTSPAPLWQEFVNPDGAIAEVRANQSAAPVLYYAAPVSVELNDNRLTAVNLATKAGRQRLAARQWIDATDAGELRALLDPTWRPPTPVTQFLQLHFRHVEWPASAAAEFTAPELPGARLHWGPSHRRNERRLTIELPGAFQRPRRAWLPALRALHASRGAELTDAVLTHGSVIPFAVYPDSEPRGLPANVVVPRTANTLAGRFEAGLQAARELAGRPQAQGAGQELLTEWPVESAEVAVAGLGTGGALAALAAARAGVKVLAFDPLPFAGGIGSGGGIHAYYFGVKGGLQQEIDDRVRAVMPLFGKISQINGFHPDAKKIVLEELLIEAGANLQFDSALGAVTAMGGRVNEALITTPRGPVRVRAAGWVDGTGDADLAAGAGAKYRLGRTGDGLLHAYSQSAGRARVKDNRAQMEIMNFDAGFCDPTDSEDLTRARLVGVSHYQQAQYDELERPTYIAPAIGLRQGRHVETEYTLTLEDLINRRQFADAIGHTGGHYDNHAKDYEFESPAAMFWVWVCLCWAEPVACEMPYRLIVPHGLKNIWLACRAVGVSEEAHHAVRMQRDVQRLGEVAGLAAAQAVRQGCAARDLPVEPLRAELAKTGAVTLRDGEDDTFGVRATTPFFQFAAEQLADWLAKIPSAPSGLWLWQLYQAGAAARPGVESWLTATDELASWRAAALLAMWGDARAEARLCRAVATREAGEKAREVGYSKQSWYRAPHWIVALSLLRECGTNTCLATLEELATDPQLVFNARTATALACEAIAQRGGDRERLRKILEQLIATPAPHALRHPGGGLAISAETPPVNSAGALPAIIEDRNWQLHYAVARARRAIGLAPHAAALTFRDDPRALVRRAFIEETDGVNR